MGVLSRLLVNFWMKRAPLDFFKTDLILAGLFKLKLALPPLVVVFVKLIVKLLLLTRSQRRLRSSLGLVLIYLKDGVINKRALFYLRELLLATLLSCF